MDYHSAPTRDNQGSPLRTQLSEGSILDCNSAPTRNRIHHFGLKKVKNQSWIITQQRQESISDHHLGLN